MFAGMLRCAMGGHSGGTATVVVARDDRRRLVIYRIVRLAGKKIGKRGACRVEVQIEAVIEVEAVKRVIVAPR